MSLLTPDVLMTVLRRHGVTVHLATVDAQGRIALFLEAGLGQQYRAKELASWCEGVKHAEFDDPQVAILFVTVTT